MVPFYKSRRFWTAIVDALGVVLSAALAHYNPTDADFIWKIYLAFQPIFLALIASYTVEDIAMIKAGSGSKYPPVP